MLEAFGDLITGVWTEWAPGILVAAGVNPAGDLFSLVSASFDKAVQG